MASLRTVCSAIASLATSLSPESVQEFPKDKESQSAFMAELLERVSLPEQLRSLKQQQGGDYKDVRWSWVGGLVLPLLRELAGVLERQEREEARQLPPPATLHPQQPPAPPPGMLSLRDYASILFALEVGVRWGLDPLWNIDYRKRKIPRAVKLNTMVLRWGESYVGDASNTMERGMACVGAIMLVLQRPEFAPILMPQYFPDCLAAVLKSQQALGPMLQHVPQHVGMSALRDLLSGGHALAAQITSQERLQVGAEMSRLLLEKGGLEASIQLYLGGSVDDMGDTQAEMHMVGMLARAPSTMAMGKYVQAIAPQVVTIILDVAKEQQHSLPAARVSVALISRFLEGSAASEAWNHALLPLLHPFLLLWGPTPAPEPLPSAAADLCACMEEQVDTGIAALEVLLSVAPPTPHLLRALHEHQVASAAFLLYSCSRAGKLRVLQPLQRIMKVLLEQSQPETAAAALLKGVLCDGTGPEAFASPAVLVCAPGGSGGVQIQWLLKKWEGESGEEQLLVELMQDLEQVGARAKAATALLASLDEECSVPGVIFTQLMDRCLLREGMQPEMQREMMLLAAVSEELGPQVFRSGMQVLDCCAAVAGHTARAAQAQASGDDMAGRERICIVVLGLMTALLELGAEKRDEAEEDALQGMLPDLKILAECRGCGEAADELTEMATTVLLLVIARSQNYQADAVQSAAVAREQEAREELELPQLVLHNISRSQADLASEAPPLRARGVVTLTKTVRKVAAGGRLRAGNVDALAPLMETFLSMLSDDESYVYLAAVQGLTVMAEGAPSYAIPALVQCFIASDEVKADQLTMQQRIKLGEALVLTARRCGEATPKYAHHFVAAFVKGARERVAAEDREGALFRASCLSNLAEVCRQLHWSIRSYAVDVTDLALGILALERSANEQDVKIRRGALFLLASITEALGDDILQIMPELLTPMLRALLHAHKHDADSTNREHAKNGLTALRALIEASTPRERAPLIEELSKE